MARIFQPTLFDFVAENSNCTVRNQSSLDMTNEPPEIKTVVQVFQSHYGMIIATASRYAPTPDLVYDVVHQVFIEFMDAAMKGNWDQSRDPGPFLYQITKITAYKLWRQKMVYSDEMVRKIGERLMEMKRNEASHFDKENESIEALNRCMKKLPEKSRDIIEKHYFHEMSIEAIARNLVVSAATLRKTLFRIRLKLRECIDAHLTKVTMKKND